MESLNAKINIPRDICEWISPEALRAAVEEELRQLIGSGNDSRLLAVLAFAYGRGIFDSDEILGLCQSDPLFRSLRANSDFVWDDMLDTRHKHRRILVTLMVALLTRALVEKFKMPGATLEPALKRSLQENAVERLDNAGIIDRGEEE